MANLKSEYIDIKDIKHNVVHLISDGDKNSRERIIEELFNVLTRPSRHMPV